MPHYYNNPHKKSKKESIAMILLDAPDRMPGDDKEDMDAEDYAMSMADEDQKKELSDIDKIMEDSDLPVEKIMSALKPFDIPDDMLGKIEKHLRGEGC